MATRQRLTNGEGSKLKRSPSLPGRLRLRPTKISPPACLETAARPCNSSQPPPPTTPLPPYLRLAPFRLVPTRPTRSSTSLYVTMLGAQWIADSFQARATLFTNILSLHSLTYLPSSHSIGPSYVSFSFITSILSSSICPQKISGTLPMVSMK